MYKGVPIYMGLGVPIYIIMNIGTGVPNIILYWGRGALKLVVPNII